MNYALRNIVSIVLVIFIIGFGYYFLFSRQQGQYIPESWADLDCIHPFTISSDELQPTLVRGSILSLNQCINDKENLQDGYIVTFKQDSIKRIGVIKDKEIKDSQTYYVITTQNDDTGQYTVLSDDILAYTIIPTDY